MSRRGDITVAILCGRRPSPVALALASLQSGTLLPAEVLLVDTQADGLSEVEPDDFRRLRLRVLPFTGGGYAEARNAAMAAITTPHAAFLDDDCEADARWLERLRSALDAAEAVGGPTLPARRPPPEADFSPEWNAFVGLSAPGFWSDRAGRGELPQTANLALRVELWKRIPFPVIDGAFSGNEDSDRRLGREDVEWWRAVRRVGAATRVEHRAIAWHDIDPDRYAQAAVLARAAADGQTRWERARDASELPRAAADIAAAPRRVVADLLDPAISHGEALHRHAPWIRRQWSLLTRAADDHGSGFTPVDRTALVAKGLVREAAALAKPLLRGGARAAWSLSRQPAEDFLREGRVRRVLVVCHDYLGDAVLCEPLLAALRRRLGAEVDVLAGPRNAGIFRLMPHVARVHVHAPTAGEGRVAAARRLARLVKHAEPDAVITTYFHDAAAEGLRAPGSPPLVCWDRDQGFARQLWADLADVVVPKSLEKHELAALLDLAGPFGVEVKLRRPRLTPRPADTDAARARLRGLGLKPGGYIAAHVDGPPGSWKAWPPEHFAALLPELARQSGLPIVAVGSPDGARLCQPGTYAHSLHGQLEPGELAAVLKDAALSLGPDSGPQHLAQAVGARTLVLFGPTAEWRWGPLPRLAGEEGPLPFVTVRAPDAPQDWLEEETGGFASDEHMRRLRPERVLEAALGMLG